MSATTTCSIHGKPCQPYNHKQLAPPGSTAACQARSGQQVEPQEQVLLQDPADVPQRAARELPTASLSLSARLSAAAATRRRLRRALKAALRDSRTSRSACSVAIILNTTLKRTLSFQTQPTPPLREAGGCSLQK